MRGKLSSVLDVTNKWSCTYMCLPFLHVSGSTGEGKVSWLESCVCLQQDKAWLHHMYSPHILTMRQSLTQACKTVQGVVDVYVCLTGDAVTDPTVN